MISCFVCATCRPVTGMARRSIVRQIEPRLSGVDVWRPCQRHLTSGRIVEETTCGSAAEPQQRFTNCNEIAHDRDAAISGLISQPLCTDAAIRSLEALSRQNSHVLNDLAAAYYVRAQRTDSPADLLRALDAVQSALAVNRSEEALFNLALIQEALGLSKEAMASWQEVQRIATTPWANEAASHIRLLLQGTRATDRELRGQRLYDVVLSGDSGALRELVTGYSFETQTRVETEVLPRWAEAAMAGDRDNARRHLDLASAIARDIALVSGDRSLLDCVERITSVTASGDRRIARLLQQGYVEYGGAWRSERSFSFQQAAAQYRAAQDALERADTPFSRIASYRVLASSFLIDGSAADEAKGIADYARERRYEHLWSSVQAFRGSSLAITGHYLEAVEAYEEAASSFDRQCAYDRAAMSRARRSAIYRRMGLSELAWRDALQAVRGSRQIGSRSRVGVFADVAETALALGFARGALLYQNVAVDTARDALAAATDRYPRELLAKALAGRAEIEVHLGSVQNALNDLESAARLASSDTVNREPMLAYIEDVRGRALLKTGSAQDAVAAFTKALSFAPRSFDSSLRANLYVQRAAAYRLVGKVAEAENDWRSATEMTVGEESSLRAAYWTGDFSKLADVYHELARHLAESGRPTDAFVYMEKARVLASSNVAYELRTLLARSTGAERAQEVRVLQSLIPPATALIEYLVLDDRTLVWIISSEGIVFVTLPLGHSTVERFHNELESASAQRNERRFTASLSAAYAALLDAPLHQLGAVGHPPSTLILIPDESMRNLPFAALRSASGRYLIEEFAMTVGSSAAQYAACLYRDQARAATSRPRVLLMGDPAFDRRSEVAFGLARLPGARAEVLKIGRLYSRSEVRTNTESTVDALLRIAPSVTLLHLASQTVSNPRSPEQQLMLFAPSAGDSGSLTSTEVVSKLRLSKARLVVLSTARAEGLYSSAGTFETAFLAAGVPAVVTSRSGVVNDMTTAALMFSFHRAFARGVDAANALRLAQLEMLHSGNVSLRSPLIWGSFEVIGAPVTLTGNAVHAAVRDQ